MADLFGSLSLAARGLAAQQAGLNAAGQNIANVNTPGYARRVVHFAATPPTDNLSAGNGVAVLGIRAQRADLLNAQLRRETPSQGREAAIADQLSQVETALGRPGTSIDGNLTNFYNSFTQLAMDPSSGVTRQQVLVQGQALASAFNNLSARLAQSQRDADVQVRASVDQINALGADISAINDALANASLTSAEALKDELGEKLDALAQIVDVNVVPRPDGGADITLGNGHALVVGISSYPITVTDAPGTGMAVLTSVGGVDLTTEITGGKLGGLLQVRDVLVPNYVTRLDQLAYGVATSVNTTHRAGYDLNGTAGVDFFVPPTGPAGAAAGLTMSAALLANTNLVAAAGTTEAGDNQNAKALANLQQAALAGGTTNPIETWGTLIYRVGTDSATAVAERKGRDEIVQQLETLRDQVSGVSLDEEAVNLTKFQRAYEANARFFSAIQASLDVLFRLAQ